MLAVSAAGTVALWASASFAEPRAWYNPDKIVDFSVGIFCPPGKSYKTDAPDTMLGEVERYSDSPILVEKTQIIPAIDGITFGVEGRENPASAADVTIVVDHPPLGAGRLTQESWSTQMEGQRITFHGYFLGLSDGNPQGLWTITGKRGGKDLFRVQFNVVPFEGTNPVKHDPCKTRLSS